MTTGDCVVFGRRSLDYFPHLSSALSSTLLAMNFLVFTDMWTCVQVVAQAYHQQLVFWVMALHQTTTES